MTTTQPEMATISLTPFVFCPVLEDDEVFEIQFQNNLFSFSVDLCNAECKFRSLYEACLNESMPTRYDVHIKVESGQVYINYGNCNCCDGGTSYALPACLFTDAFRQAAEYFEAEQLR